MVNKKVSVAGADWKMKSERRAGQEPVGLLGREKDLGFYVQWKALKSF